MVVLPRAGRPGGNAVQFDVTDASANAVLKKLRDFRLDGDSQVDVAAIDATIGSGRPRTYHGEHPPVWPVVEARIRENAEYAPSFFALLAFAGLIGACGILTNSQILIVGAMVVGPEYSAIIAAGLGIDRRDGRDRQWIARTRAGLFLRYRGNPALRAVYSVGGPGPGSFRRGVRPVSDLINSPDSGQRFIWRNWTSGQSRPGVASEQARNSGDGA